MNSTDGVCFVFVVWIVLGFSILFVPNNRDIQIAITKGSDLVGLIILSPFFWVIVAIIHFNYAFLGYNKICIERENNA